MKKKGLYLKNTNYLLRLQRHQETSVCFIKCMKRTILFFILLLAFGLRIYGLNWDEERHFHPDERALIMVADKIHLFDQMNPNFFNYGSLPIYLLKGTAQGLDSLLNIRLYANYDGLLAVGRWLSVFSDMITLFFVCKIANLITGWLGSYKKTQDSRNSNLFPLFAVFFYSVMFFPIQNSHFFVVDVFLTTLTTILVYLFLLYLQHDYRYKKKFIEIDRNLLKLIVIGTVYGAMMATKVSSLVFLPVIFLGISIPFILEIINKKKLIEMSSIFLKLVISFFIFLLVAFISFAFFMPYAFIEWERFIRDVTAQITMNGNPYIFPYTLQYVGTTPYFYYLKNMFLYGVGPFISILAMIGLFVVVYRVISTMLDGSLLKKFFDKLFILLPQTWLRRASKTMKEHKNKLKGNAKYSISNIQLLILSFFLLFYLFYFSILGRSAVKFMRYMLPLYPFIAILAGYGIVTIYKHISKRTIYFNYFIIGYVLLVIGYSAMFVNMYSYKNTRITATEWMMKNLPIGSVLGVEHWDDRLPVYGGERFRYEELGLYELPDDETKWNMMREKLNRVDYIILASNRLYVPLQKLTDCNKYKKCYPLTAQYYQDLFSGRLGFTRIADFHVYPTVPFSELLFDQPVGIDDQGADESFTVYDHPRVMVFGRTNEK